MPSKSKNKGNALEREVRDILNKTYGTEEFARTPSSGSIMGLSNYDRNKGLSEQVQTTLGSDLICPEWFKFSVESKWYADSPNYSTLIKGPDTDLNGWLGEACFDAQNMNLIPLLVFKTNRKGTHVALPIQFASELHLQYFAVYDEFIIISIETFIQNAERIRDASRYLLPEIIEWLKSEPIQLIIQEMQSKKKKKNK